MSEQEHFVGNEPESLMATTAEEATGIAVYDPAGAKLGVVSKTVEPGFLVVSRGLFFKHDVYLPLEAVGAQEPDAIYLRYTKDELLGRDWGAPPTKQHVGEGGLAAMEQRPPKEEMQQRVKDEGHKHDDAHKGGPLPG